MDWSTPPAPTSTAGVLPAPEDAAVVQYTSGSTAAPKGAVLSHRAVLAQVRAHHERLPDPRVVLGWSPFFHDLGLFFYVVASPLDGQQVHVLPTERFARDPSEWLRLVPEVGATMLVAPQSAWSAALGAARRRDLDIDLRTVEAAWFAAEAIDPSTVDRMEALAPSLCLDPRALGATYGLAEAVLGVTTSLPGAGLDSHTVDRDLLARERRADAPRQGVRTRRVVSCGVPMRDMHIRVVDGASVLPDGHIGEIEVRGPSLMSGYLDGGSGLDPEGWLATGDLGYLHAGELYVTGRSKDVLIVLGQNFHPEDFEWAADRVPGVRPGRCAAFLDGRGEHLVLVVEPQADADPAALAATVRRATAAAVGTPPGTVVVAPPGTVEKTTSGKVRRSAMRARHLTGELPALCTSP